jgi:hypothetical protein
LRLEDAERRPDLDLVGVEKVARDERRVVPSPASIAIDLRSAASWSRMRFRWL